MPRFLKSSLGWIGRVLGWRTAPAEAGLYGMETGLLSPDVHSRQTKSNAAAAFEESAPLLDSSALIQKLKGCAEGLKRICTATEPDFLNLGSQLQTIQADSDALTQQVVAVLSTEQEQTVQGALRTIQTHAAEAIQELNQRRSKLAADLEGLKAIQGDMTALGKQNNSFKQVAKNLKMVGLNISIESARTDEAKATFQALAEEITHLAQTVWEVANAVSDDTNMAQQNLNSIQADISQRMRHLEELIGSADQTVSKALVEVENLMQLTMHVLDGIGAKATQISEQVGRLVVSIQIHDNMSQRVNHIDLSMDEAVDIVQTSKGIELPQAAMRVIFGKVYGINRLQIVQLKTIEDDVAEVRRQTGSALEHLLAAVKAVAQPEGFDFSNSGGVCQFDTANSRHPVAVLRRALEQLLELFDAGVDDLRRLTAAREQTAQTIARMGAHIDKVRDINFDIRLKALNAVIKSTRLGETGKAIEAIVNEMKELAEQSNTTIQSVTDIMEGIASASQSLDQTTRNDAQEADAAGRLLREGIDQFTSACVAFKEQSYSALENGRHIEEKIIQARRRTDFFDRLLAVFRKHHADLKQFEKLLQPFSGAAPEDWMEEEKNIKARYTMQRELDAHEKISNGGKEQKIAKKQKEPAAAVQSSAGFDDNVELF